MIGEVFKLMGSNISNDWYILLWCAVTVIFLVICLVQSKNISKYVNDWYQHGITNSTKYQHACLRRTYNLFTSAISIFPLLGMFGTVAGLIAMDFSAGNMENMKQNFFGALTSTAWGIVFSVVFKMIHAAVQELIEKNIIASEKMEKKLTNHVDSKVSK